MVCHIEFIDRILYTIILILKGQKIEDKKILFTSCNNDPGKFK